MSAVTAFKIKHELMYYFRFKRQWLCASECRHGDVMAITDKDCIEVEIKISKSDLWNGEAKKGKHPLRANTVFSESYVPNRFYICVPHSLEEEARVWVDKICKDYGIIRYSSDYNPITIAKTAKIIHSNFSESLKKDIMMRLCSENIGLMGRFIKNPTLLNDKERTTP